MAPAGLRSVSVHSDRLGEQSVGLSPLDLVRINSSDNRRKTMDFGNIYYSHRRGQEFVDDTIGKLTSLAFEFVKETDDDVFMAGVSICQSLLKSWMEEIRADTNRSPDESALVIARSSNSPSYDDDHYCQFRNAFSSTKNRSCWRWQGVSGWQMIASSAVSSPNFGSRYIVACESPTRTEHDDDGGQGGDHPQSPECGGDGVIEFHVCDPHDCARLAAAMKCTVSAGDTKPMFVGEREEDDTDGLLYEGSSLRSGCVDLINNDKQSPMIVGSSMMVADGGFEPASHPSEINIHDYCGCKPTESIRSRRPTTNEECETVAEAITTTIHHRDSSSKKKSSSSSDSSRSGFLSHYAYERTCDMLLSSMASSKKILPSVVIDETEQLRSQCAGRVRQLVRMFDDGKATMK